ncbi:MAG: hypothetical protein IJZ56_03405 [Oscillospiraceae bacterium]|nr:hypothetical protein [Oscillospiraceae bacterium]
MYITFDEYAVLYDPMEEKVFNRLAFDACRVMDIHTTGIDNVKKLKRFFPTDEDDVETVKRCAAKIINLLYQIQEAENAAAMGRGYELTEQGMRGKVISSVSAGNESISYSTSGNDSSTAIDAAVKDKTVRDSLIANTVRECLPGVTDANGVNLLYMGRYPNV